MAVVGAFAGRPRPVGAGRKPGTPNKDVLAIRGIYDRAAYVGWNPVEEMSRIGYTGLLRVFDPKTCLPVEPPEYVKIDSKTRCAMLKEAAEYGFSKRKAIEFQDQDGNPLANGLLIEFVSGEYKEEHGEEYDTDPQYNSIEKVCVVSEYMNGQFLEAEVKEKEEEG